MLVFPMQSHLIDGKGLLAERVRTRKQARGYLGICLLRVFVVDFVDLSEMNLQAVRGHPLAVIADWACCHVSPPACLGDSSAGAPYGCHSLGEDMMRRRTSHR